MATVRHLGLFSKVFQKCPQPEPDPLPSFNRHPEIWLSPQYATAMYWRVKKWKFSIDASWNEITSVALWNYSKTVEFEVGQIGSTIQILPDFFEEIEGQPPSLPEMERKLVCGLDAVEIVYPEWWGGSTILNGQFYYLVAIRNLQAVGGGAGTNFNANIYWTYGGVPSPAAYFKTIDGSVFLKPTIHFEASTVRWVDIRANNFPTSQGTYGKLSYKLLGQTFETDIYARNTRSTDVGFANFLDIQINLEATEYWPYDPNDGGGPIYDKTTGQQLRPFPA